MTPKATTLRPWRVTPSKAGNATAWLAFPWLFGVLFATSAALSALGLPGPYQSVLFRWVVVMIALAPGVMYTASPWLGRVPGFRWLLAVPQPLAIIDDEGIQFQLPGIGMRRFAWQDVASLELRTFTWKQPRGELLGLDGSVLTTIPVNLVYLKATWFTAPTLAEMVVKARPDRYILTSAQLGRPDSFCLIGSAVERLDMRAAERRREWLFWALVSVMVIVGLVAVVLFYARPV